MTRGILRARQTRKLMGGDSGYPLCRLAGGRELWRLPERLGGGLGVVSAEDTLHARKGKRVEIAEPAKRDLAALGKSLRKTHFNPESLRRARKAAGFTQKQAAELVGASVRAIGFYECAQRTPSVDVAAALARAYGIVVEALFDFYNPGGVSPDDIEQFVKRQACRK